VGAAQGDPSLSCPENAAIVAENAAIAFPVIYGRWFCRASSDCVGRASNRALTQIHDPTTVRSAGCPAMLVPATPLPLPLCARTCGDSLVRRGTEMAGRIWLPRGVFISAGRRGGLMLPVYAAAGIGRGFGRGGRLRMFVAPIHATAGIGVDFDRRICRRRGSRRRCRAGRR